MIPDMNMLNFSSKDLTIASMLLFSMICLASGIYSLFDLTPGFFLPLTAALGTSLTYKIIDYRQGRRSIIALQKVSKEIIIFAVSSIIFGLFMPMMFPAGAYDDNRWLVYINAIFLVGGMVGIPMVKGHSTLLKLVTRKRIENTK
jgi:hypothetical protein